MTFTDSGFMLSLKVTITLTKPELTLTNPKLTQNPNTANKRPLDTIPILW